MKGLIIWAQSYCRSTLSFYIELTKCFGVDAKIYITNNAKLLHRQKVGFKEDEFCDAAIHQLNNDCEVAVAEMYKYKDYNHLFTSYQNADICGILIQHAIRSNIRYGIMSEAPCNMEPNWYRRLLKRVYLKTALKWRVKDTIRYADFIINYSGYYEEALISLGWKPMQIIPCGYYSPPLPGSTFKKRTSSHWKDFTILLSGLHQWHRSPMLLLKALRELDRRGVKYRCIITQEGAMLNTMKKFVARFNMTNVEFLGFIPLSKLIELYETCSVYVGAGNAEPWGMRLNDVLQCGSPLIVNRGMGGAKLVDDYGCGLNFNKGDYIQLAKNLEDMIINEQLYLSLSANAVMAVKQIAPGAKAFEIYDKLKKLGYIAWHN